MSRFLTGINDLDRLIDSLYVGNNVVWEVEGGEVPSKETFILLDCFTSGKGKNDRAFVKFYENYSDTDVVRVEKPADIAHFTTVLNSIEDSLPSGTRYIFDSLTGMQDLWGG